MNVFFKDSVFRQYLRARHVLCVTILLLLAGCATSTRLPSINFSQPLPSDGIVSLLLTNNTGSVTYDSMTFDRIADASGTPLAEPKSYTIAGKRIPGSDFEYLFVSSISPGLYRVREFSYENNNYRAWITLPDSTKNNFVAKAGTISDLGRVVQTKMSADRVLSVRAPNESHIYDYLELVYPKVKSGIDRSHPTHTIGWEERADKLDHFFYKLTKLSARDFNQPNFNQQGVMVAGTRLGGVLTRSPKGKWKLRDTWVNHTIQSATMLPENKIFAAAELNNFFIIDQKGLVETMPNNELPVGRVISSHYSESNGLVIGLLNRSGLNIYKSKSLSSPDWKLTQTIQRSFSLFLSEDKITVDRHNQQLLFGRGDDLFIYNMDTNLWEEKSTPFAIENLRVYGDKWVAWGRYLLAKKTYISFDQGETWQETNTRSSDSMMQFDSTGAAYVVSSDENGMIKKSDDMGKTWYVYDHPTKGFEMGIHLNGAMPVIMAQDDTILIYVTNLPGGGNSVLGYNVHSKKLIPERIASLPRLIKYLEKRWNSQKS